MLRRSQPTVWVVLGLLALSLPAINIGSARAQLELTPPALPVPAAVDPASGDPADGNDLPEGAEVMVTGPLHEAFAEQFSEQVEPGMVVNKTPPDPIDEVPPEYRPEGEDIVWIPGYWGWDPERDDFVWITGIWRQTPPGRNWVPGYWAEVPEGFQWIAGFWSLSAAEEIRYLPPPPEPLAADPSTPAPSEDHFWVPGQWNYVENDYQWRAGYWTMSYPDWVWVPDRYVWTPSGCIYRAGYWDYMVAERGTVFCPVYWSQPVVNYRFRPSYVVATGPTLLANLFVYPRYHHYFFGNYYSSRYLGQTIYPWVTYGQQGRRYDPLYGYYRTQYRDVDYMNRLLRLHNYYAANVNYQPPRTLAAQFEHRHDFQDRQDLAFHALRISQAATSTNNFNQSLQLIRLADNERQQIQRGLDPARNIWKQRAQFERQARDGFPGPGNATAGNVPGNDNPKRDLNRADLQNRRWNLPRGEDRNGLGAVALGPQRPADQTDRKGDRDRNDGRGDNPRGDNPRGDIGRNDRDRGQAGQNGRDPNPTARDGQDRTPGSDRPNARDTRPDATRPDATRPDATRPGLPNAGGATTNPADVNRDGVVNGRDARKPDMRDGKVRDGQPAAGRDGQPAAGRDQPAAGRDGQPGPARDPATARDPLNREPGKPDNSAGRDAPNRDPATRTPNTRDPNTRDGVNRLPGTREPGRPDGARPTPGMDPNRPGVSPGTRGDNGGARPGILPSAPGATPGNGNNNNDRNRGKLNPTPSAGPATPNLAPGNLTPGNRTPGNLAPGNPGNRTPRAGSPAAPGQAGNRSPGLGNPATPGQAGNSSPANIQGDLQKMRELSQRQTQRRSEAGGAPRRAPQPPSEPRNGGGRGNEKPKDK